MTSENTWKDLAMKLTERVRELEGELQEVAERQREACAKEVEGVETYKGGDQDEEGLRDACVGAVRDTPLMTVRKEKL